MLDLLKFNKVNLDILTETYNVAFYGRYLAHWPEYCKVAEAPSGDIQGYVLGKVEGDKEDNGKKNWHGHVTAVTVAPSYRRQGLAKALMKYLEDTTVMHDGFFVDLFVRKSNEVAIGMYQGMGYSIYRTVVGYYSGPEEDAYDMRKAMPRDTTGATLVTDKTSISPSELEFH
jgi:N-terminal acetyltransferase B complex catalytic subunit